MIFVCFVFSFRHSVPFRLQVQVSYSRDPGGTKFSSVSAVRPPFSDALPARKRPSSSSPSSEVLCTSILGLGSQACCCPAGCATQCPSSPGPSLGCPSGGSGTATGGAWWCPRLARPGTPDPHPRLNYRQACWPVGGARQSQPIHYALGFNEMMQPLPQGQGAVRCQSRLVSKKISSVSHNYNLFHTALPPFCCFFSFLSTPGMGASFVWQRCDHV